MWFDSQVGQKVLLGFSEVFQLIIIFINSSSNTQIACPRGRRSKPRPHAHDQLRVDEMATAHGSNLRLTDASEAYGEHKSVMRPVG